MPLTVRNVCNLHSQKQTDYVKEKIYQSILFAKVGDDLNKGELLLLYNKGMEHSDDKIDYESIIEYAFS